MTPFFFVAADAPAPSARFAATAAAAMPSARSLDLLLIKRAPPLSLTTPALFAIAAWRGLNPPFVKPVGVPPPPPTATVCSCAERSCAEAGVKLRPAGSVEDLVAGEMDRAEGFEKAESDAPNEVRRTLSLSTDSADWRVEFAEGAEGGRGAGSTGVRLSTGRFFGDVDFDLLRSSEKNEVEVDEFPTAGLVGAVEVGLGLFELGVGGFELREFEREGEEVRERERWGRPRVFAVSATMVYVITL